ncbi:MAG: hypothetical protein NVSMB3_13600 [Acidobacteriaceae bacterium]
MNLYFRICRALPGADIFSPLCYCQSQRAISESLMSGPPQLLPNSKPTAPPVAEGETDFIKRPTPVWLQRLSLFVLVMFCVYLGVLVLILPWWTRVWDHNMLIAAHPALAAVLHNGAVRGIISGFGLLDIWIGISEAVHYRDYRG